MQGPLLLTVLSWVLPQFPGWWICLGWGSTALPPALLPHLHAWIGYSNPFVVPGPPWLGITSPFQGGHGATCPISSASTLESAILLEPP